MVRLANPILNFAFVLAFLAAEASAHNNSPKGLKYVGIAVTAMIGMFRFFTHFFLVDLLHQSRGCAIGLTHIGKIRRSEQKRPRVPVIRWLQRLQVRTPVRFDRGESALPGFMQGSANGVPYRLHHVPEAFHIHATIHDERDQRHREDHHNHLMPTLVSYLRLIRPYASRPMRLIQRGHLSLYLIDVFSSFYLPLGPRSKLPVSLLRGLPARTY